MSMLGVNDILAVYRYANKTQKNTAAGKTGFADTVKQTAENSSASRTEVYKDYLKQKYGNVRYESIGRDEKSLDKVAKSMSGNDVVIAPNILEQMATDSEKAAYYEGKIDYFFNTVIPRETAICASKGLVFEPCGVVVHEDGTVTYICGCSDSPERVAEVNAINKAKQEKRAALRKAALERSEESAENRRQLVELQYHRQLMAQALQKNSLKTTVNYHFISRSQVSAAAMAYEGAISTYGGGLPGDMTTAEAKQLL